jgi:hypothetical protein
MSVRLLTALDEAQLRRLEPHLYHLVLAKRPRPETTEVLERTVEADAAPDPYAVVVEPLRGWHSVAVPHPFRLPHACHVSLIARSPIVSGIARALSQLAGGPTIICYESLEAAYAGARDAVAAAKSVQARRAPRRAAAHRAH